MNQPKKTKNGYWWCFFFDGDVKIDSKPRTADTGSASAAIIEFSINVNYTESGPNGKPRKVNKIQNTSEIADTSTENFMIVRTKITFVDKSKYIKIFFECDDSVVQVIVPRRFGKLTFMNWSSCSWRY